MRGRMLARGCSTSASFLEKLSAKIGRPCADLRTVTHADFLSAKALNAKEIEVIAELLAANPAVELVDVDGNGFGAEGGAHVARLLRTAPSLRTLKLGSNNLRASVADIVATAEHTSLEMLSVEANAVNAKTCALIGDALSSPACPLREINLSYNAFGAAGGEALSRSLRGDSKLEALSLRSCSIRASGAAAIAEALSGATAAPLHTLDLHECFIGADGAIAIGAMLGENRSLSTLVLSDNSLGSDEGGAVAAARALGSGLLSNTMLRTLDIRLNRLPPDAEEELQHAVAKRPTPLELRM
jgi:Ran GTPase-activating protein (RanGAP) involved in mRNA processing and transport